MAIPAPTTIPAFASGLVAALAVTMTAGLAVAQSCDGATTQAVLDACAGKAYARADGALNVSYGNVLDRLRGDGATKTLFVSAQKAWLAFRDAECTFEAAPSSGGSIHSMVVTDCKTILTRARTDALRHLLTCGEGDVICPLPPN